MNIEIKFDFSKYQKKLVKHWNNLTKILKPYNDNDEWVERVDKCILALVAFLLGFIYFNLFKAKHKSFNVNNKSSQVFLLLRIFDIMYLYSLSSVITSYGKGTFYFFLGTGLETLLSCLGKHFTCNKKLKN